MIWFSPNYPKGDAPPTIKVIRNNGTLTQSSFRNQSVILPVIVPLSRFSSIVWGGGHGILAGLFALFPPFAFRCDRIRHNGLGLLHFL